MPYGSPATVSGSLGSGVLEIVCGDRVTPIVQADNIASRLAPFDITVDEVQAYLESFHASGTFTVRVKAAGVTILSTNITIDAGESSSLTATIPPVISDTTVAKGQIISVDVTDDADGTASGLQVNLVYS